MISGDRLSQSVTTARQIGAQMLQVETNGTTAKAPTPSWWFSTKRSRPINRGGIKQVYLLAPLKTQRERRGSPGHTLPSGDPREAREHEGKVWPGRTAELLGSGLELVVVDQTAGLDDGTLLRRHIGNVELNLLDRTVGAHHVGGDVL